MALNDVKTDAGREEIVFGKSIDWEEDASGGVRRFRGLDAETAQRLIDEGYLDPDGKQNYSPTAREIVTFALENGAVVDGYMVSPSSSDARISREGLSIPSKHCDAETIAAFARKFRHADEFMADTEHGCSCWFD
jgi:hypothetical protein